MKVTDNFEKLKYLTGRTDDDLLLLGHETGLLLIERIEEGDRELIAAMERSTYFWNWYYRQMGLVAGDFMGIYAAEHWLHMGKEQVWKKFAEYLSNVLVSEVGKSSYCHLVTEIIEPELRRQRRGEAKTEGIISPTNF